MICLQCGYCCKNYFVPIVDNPNKGLDENNLIMHTGDGTPCKHLTGNEPGKYSCSIHHYSWYKETPCFSHTQVENKNCDCRIGRHIIDNLGK